jgi:MFS family permease
MHKIAQRNIKIHGWINFMSGILFLIPIITLFYKFTGLSLFEIIVISNVSTLCIWIFELPTSVLADTTGRKKSMLYSVVCNFLAALMIFIFPSYIGFIVAAVFAALYWSFWSGTGQAFLEENLRVLKREGDFGKVIGSFMFYGELGTLATPVIASLILKYFGDAGFRVLAGLDVLFAITLIILVLKLTETTKLRKGVLTWKKALDENMHIAKVALKNVFHNSKLKLFMIYRSLSHHMLFFGIILLPTLSERGMEDWYAGIVVAVSTLGSMFAAKYAYLYDKKFSYNSAWVLGTAMQAVCMIIAALVLNSWIAVAVIYVIFCAFDGLWQPSWNHILVELTKGKAIATTRSIIFAMFALYMTIGKQALSFISIEHALIGLGVFILLVNLVLGRKILSLNDSK